MKNSEKNFLRNVFTVEFFYFLIFFSLLYKFRYTRFAPEVPLKVQRSSRSIKNALKK